MTSDCRVARLARKREIHKQLATTFPGLFDRNTPKPLAIGTTRSLIERVPDIAHWELRGFLRFWCSRKRYLEAVARGGARFNLDGTVAGEVSEAHRTYASRRLARWP
jgi:sRNA-binding protein